VIDLRGKVALVTGSARRVGRAIALGLAAVSYTHLTLPTKA
jgi:NAD(P)-dependent dehydrogenase (short-subunit alcohol dehydrogenase family)